MRSVRSCAIAVGATAGWPGVGKLRDRGLDGLELRALVRD